VRLQSQDGALPNAGTLTVAGVSSGAISGSVRQDGTTDANGSVVFSNVPRSPTSRPVPPSGLANAGITTTNVALAGAAASTARSVNLGSKSTQRSPVAG